MIRLMALVPLLAAGGFAESPLTSGQWTEFQELTDAQRETLRDRHGLWLRVHPQDHAEIEKLGLDFERDADGKPSHQAPLVDRAGSELREQEEELRKAYEGALADLRRRHNERKAYELEEQRRRQEGERRRLADDKSGTSKAPDASRAAQGRETTVVDPTEASPSGVVESDSKAGTATTTTIPATTNTKTTASDKDTGKSKRKDS